MVTSEIQGKCQPLVSLLVAGVRNGIISKEILQVVTLKVELKAERNVWGFFFPHGFIKKEKKSSVRSGRPHLPNSHKLPFCFKPQAFTAVKKRELEKENKPSGFKILCIGISPVSEILGLSSGFIKLMVKLPQAGIQF